MISKESIESMLEETKIPFRFHHFEEEEAVNPPFICWTIRPSNNFFADGKVYYEKSQLNIELYTDAKDFSLEERIKMALEKHGLAWQKEEEYIESEKMYEAIFEVEV